MKKILFIFLTALVLFRCETPERKAGTVLNQGRDEIYTADSDRQETEIDSKPDKEEIDPMADPKRLGIEFYPMPPEQPRLQFLVSIKDDNDEGAGKFPVTRTNISRIKRPYDINAVRGKIYISDRSFKKILIVDLEEMQMNYIAGNYESAGIWVTENDYKYAADFANNQIIVFDKYNKLTKIYAYRDQFDKPVDVAVFQNKIYVSDLNKHHILVMDKGSGKTIQKIGGIGTEEGKFYKPTHVIVDILGNIYVNDLFNFRIQKFDPNGNFLKSFGRPGDTLGSFARPKGLSIDREGHLYVVDAAFENIQIFDNETTDLLLFFGGFGIDDGHMYLPSSVYIDYHNIEYFEKYADKDFKLKYLVYVGNSLGPVKINVFGFGEWIGPPFLNAENKIKK
jgi:hypothetical protein